jgi:ACT domain-containing protein
MGSGIPPARDRLRAGPAGTGRSRITPLRGQGSAGERSCDDAPRQTLNHRHIQSITSTRTGESMSKTIITVVGKDAVGIIAKICTYLAENQVNVEDISQTIVQGYFNMMMIVDTSGSTKPYAEMVIELEDLGDDIGVKVRCQREDIFTKMHRI